MGHPTVGIAIVNVLKLTALPVCAMLVGSVTATFKVPSPVVKSATEHFAAGVVFAAVAVELLPLLTPKSVGWLPLAVGFGVGVLAMLGIKTISGGHHDEGGHGGGHGHGHGADEESQPILPKGGQGHGGGGHSHGASHGDGHPAALGGVPTGMLAAVGVDIFIDGALIGIAAAAGKSGGIIMAIALTIEILFLGIATSASMSSRKVPAVTAIIITIGLPLCIFAGGVAGVSALSNVSQSSPLFTGIIAFGVAALLFLVTEELLLEAHEGPKCRRAWGCLTPQECNLR
eukprot:TRINITY_DN9523_c0_g1_i1.p1 TRINITY_DN9523_c0_g1~~TRINITY_DN9523_c0_g1_i1.p1  ORF type:complete len:305 (-),score=57.51 TRINITY_DN9523_c0_g1_i1:104-964(-)